MQTYIPCHAPALFDRAELAAKSAQGVVCAILCAATAEAFIHDLTEWYKVSVQHKDSCPNKKQKQLYSRERNQFCISELHQLTDTEEAIYNKLIQLEFERKCIVKKYDAIRKITCGDRWKRGEQPYQNFSTLLQIRNAIVHIKGEALSAKGSCESGANISQFKGYPKFLDNFNNMGMLCKFDSFTSWIELIETIEFSNWCTESVSTMIKAAKEALPETPITARFKINSRLTN